MQNCRAWTKKPSKTNVGPVIYMLFWNKIPVILLVMQNSWAKRKKIFIHLNWKGQTSVNCECWLVSMKSFFPRLSLSLSLLLLKQSCYGSVTLYKQETASSLCQTVNLNISMSNCHFFGLPARGEDLRSSGGGVLGRGSERRMEDPHRASGGVLQMPPG